MLQDTSRNFLGFDADLLSYVDSVSSPEPAVLAELRQETLAHPFAVCQVTHRQGLFLQLMVKATGAKKVIDVGSFTGYSGLCMALALPEDGWLVGMEVDNGCAEVAQRYLEKAGVSHKTEMRVGLALARPGGLLIYDNTLLSGSVPQKDEDAARRKLAELWPAEIVDVMVIYAGQTREFNEKISNDPRADVLLLPFEDGLTIAVKGTSE